MIANGRKHRPAEKILMAPICIPVKCFELSFIRINELPHIKEIKINNNQLVKFCLAIALQKCISLLLIQQILLWLCYLKFRQEHPRNLIRKKPKQRLKNYSQNFVNCKMFYMQKTNIPF